MFFHFQMRCHMINKTKYQGIHFHFIGANKYLMMQPKWIRHYEFLSLNLHFAIMRSYSHYAHFDEIFSKIRKSLNISPKNNP